jgi:hypothetical protein
MRLAFLASNNGSSFRAIVGAIEAGVMSPAGNGGGAGEAGGKPRIVEAG